MSKLALIQSGVIEATRIKFHKFHKLNFSIDLKTRKSQIAIFSYLDKVNWMLGYSFNNYIGNDIAKENIKK